MNARVMVLGFAAFLATEGYAQSFYKAVGPDGKISYSTRPPAKGRIEKTLIFENLPSSKVPNAGSWQPATNPDITRTSGVVLYAADWCGFCKKAKAYLASKNIIYQEINIDTVDGKGAFAQVSGGNGIPLLFSDGRRVQGFSSEAYDEVFAGK
ncbi:MAG: glutaredoxin family protein [Methyloglobulus sp.]|nr:glutaredoxin family protein [Methyloglobulus sp.]